MESHVVSRRVQEVGQLGHMTTVMKETPKKQIAYVGGANVDSGEL